MQTPEGFTTIQEAFRNAGPLILQHAGKIDDHATKTDGSPVTEIDRQVEATIFEYVTTRHPGLKIFGEETGYNEENLDQPCWLIDPIDGTASFIKNIPAFTSMAVFIENNEATASIVYNPSTDDMYTSIKGVGTFKNGERIDLRSVPLPKVAHCKERYATSLNELFADTGIQSKPGVSGIGKDITLLLDGEIAARFSMPGGGYVHDYAGGFLMMQEAGGEIIPTLDDTVRYTTKSFVACHPGFAGAVLAHRDELTELQKRLG